MHRTVARSYCIRGNPFVMSKSRASSGVRVATVATRRSVRISSTAPTAITHASEFSIATTSRTVGRASRALSTDATNGTSERPRKRTKVAISNDDREDADFAEDDEAKQRKKRQRKPKHADFSLKDFASRVQNDWKIGPHVSASGGVENTIVNAASIGANAFALFLKSQRKWSSPDLKPDSVESFKFRLKEYDYSPEHIVPHGSYLVNLGNPDVEKRNKSYECFLDDLQRCEQLGLRLYNFHPGSTVGQISTEECLSLIAECINKAHKATKSVVIVLENMAGSGNVIGSTFSEIGGIIKQVDDKSRVGVCVDTCHSYAAGYDIRTKEGWNKLLEEFDREIGLKYLRGMHLNDSKGGLGSKKDRHENIGLGELSLSTFSHIVTDPRTKNIPLILETPAYDAPGSGLLDGMEVWKKEVEVLNRLSSNPDASQGELDAWTQEIRKVVREASSKKNAKGGKQKEKETDRTGGKVGDGKGKAKKTMAREKRKTVEEEDEESSSLSELEDSES
ncbi:AP endonuclease [Panus rudis PR-1116 ss-1]|nr:AP endonuclease [Panus rudis PR-1116 ss-1]